MKKITIILSSMALFLGFFVSQNLYAQKSQRMVLLEQFTNAS
jgi:hypothetical protein